VSNKELNGRHCQLLSAQQWLQHEINKRLKLNKHQSGVFNKLQTLVILEILEIEKSVNHGEHDA
jgi:hypothetical protein